ncbi:hypothetical protein AVDCRST_MAG81-1121 [uncultured Synechococcales cyanobacterium]|uniref:DUF350 domain-containing protein n=1 Tax=uncultured Synechococcales cyanobacterium TaxID=1936017 RepID=A0A6J4V194_9CYAN|nr:hypothetical protein AVDCRST_MAG81-1121 [uncultured Synechococcales cyanobacterium]
MLLLQKIAETVGWTVVGVLLFYGGVRLYDFLDPIDYREEVKRGNVAAGILISAIIIALAAIVITVLVT